MEDTHSAESNPLLMRHIKEGEEYTLLEPLFAGADRSWRHLVPRGKYGVVKLCGSDLLPGEPVVIFRGNDALAVEVLQFFKQVMIREGCGGEVLTNIEKDIRDFEQWAISDESKMKLPD